MKIEEDYEITFELLYDTLPKQQKKYVKKLKKKALRTSRDKNQVYRVLAEETQRIAVNDTRIAYPNVKEHVKELTANLPKINIKKEAKKNLSTLFIFVALFFVVRSAIHLYTGRNFEITGRDAVILVIFFLNLFASFTYYRYFRWLIIFSVFVLAIIQEEASKFKFSEISASTGFIIAAVFVIITLFFRKK